MRNLLAFLLTLATAPPLAAHPHIFVDTGFELVLDETGNLTAIRVTWAYDDFYSLLITEDYGLDADGDGVLTAAENEQLTGFDMQWIDGFAGDTEMVLDGAPVALSAPEEATAKLEDGRITTTHLRRLDPVVPPGKMAELMAYDPTYYTAYELTRPVTVTGGACHVRLKAPEVGGDLLDLQKQVAELDTETDPEDAGLPNIGKRLASRVIVTCGAA
jgi:ABC-type uncharacterized transport system substrate-binding protein